MGIASMVLPLEGGSPSAVMVVIFADGLMLFWGDMGEDGFFKLDKGNRRYFDFSSYPYLKQVYRGGKIHLAILIGLLATEKRF